MTVMMDEMLQQPALLDGLRKYYADREAIPTKKLKQLASPWPPMVVFTGMASSLFAAYPAQAFLSSRGIRALVWETADLVHYHTNFLGKDTLLVVVSQSGESVEIQRLLELLPNQKASVAVVNVETSRLARRCKLLLRIKAGTQTTVSMKTYGNTVAVLMYLAFAIAGEPSRDLDRVLDRASKAQERILHCRETFMPPILEFFGDPRYVMVLSRGADLSTVYEGALYFKEVTRLTAEPMSAGQFRHGPLETISPDHRYIVIARRWKTGKLLMRLADFITRNGGRVLVITDMPCDGNEDRRVIRAEPLRLCLGTLVDTIYLQLLTHSLALRRGLDPGKFWIHDQIVRVE